MSRVDAWIVTIGDELLRGEIVDSNKSFLSERLLQLDLECARHLSVPDDPEAIEEVLREAAQRARVVIVSGGLGPTRDDITTEVAARAFGRRLVRDEGSLRSISEFFRRFGREMAENNAKQADFPEGAEVLPNPMGTAPGFLLEAEGALLFFTPGVPRELYRMTDSEILPRIRARLGEHSVVRAALLRTFGMGESDLDRDLRDLARGDPAVSMGFRTQFPDNLIRLVVRGRTAAEAERRLEAEVERVRARLGPIVLGRGERTLEEIVGGLLLEQKKTLALAESCTGGLVAHRLTEVPGSSAYLLEAVVAYSDDAKRRTLGVPAEELAEHGAVSDRVARRMAEGVRERAGADLGVAVTGIAGPTGGSEAKPVGTCFIALAEPGYAYVQRFQLMNERARNKELASHIALDWVRRRLLGIDLATTLYPRLGRGAAERT